MEKNMKTKIRKAFIKSSSLLLLLSLSGCAGYGSSFTCPDANGLYCAPVSVVDQRIDSGEIIEVQKSKKCKGRNCRSNPDDIKPDIKADKVHKVKLQTQETIREYRDGDILYIK